MSSIEIRVKSLLKSGRGVAKIFMSFKINSFPLKSIFLYDVVVHWDSCLLLTFIYVTLMFIFLPSNILIL